MKKEDLLSDEFLKQFKILNSKIIILEKIQQKNRP